MNKTYGRFGLGRQTNATDAVAPVVTFLASGDSQGIDANANSEAIRLTNGLRDTTAYRYNSGSEATASVTTILTDNVLAAVMKAALGKDVVTGSNKPYVHTVTMGEALDYYTFTEQKGSASAPMSKLAGCKVTSVSIEAEGSTPPTMDIELAGCKFNTGQAGSWPSEAALVDPMSDGFYITAGAEVLFSANTNTPGAVPASIVLQSFSCEFQNDMESTVEFGQVEAKTQDEGASTVTCSLNGTTSDTELWRIIKTGSETGTELSSNMVVGSLQVTFKHSKNSDWSFTLKFPAVPWNISSMSVDPEGGPFDLELSTDGAINMNGTSVESVFNSNTPEV